MPVQSNFGFRSAFKSFTKGAGIAVALLGVIVLIGGWGLDIVVLKSVLPGLATMKANTALAFACAGAALWLLQAEKRGSLRGRAGQVCALIATLIGGLTLAEYIFGWNLGIDELLFADAGSLGGVFPPGRPAPNTALGIFLTGLALLALDLERRAGSPAEWLALTAGLIAFVGLLGYAYGVQSLYRVTVYSSMSLHTAFALLVLAIGILAARPNRGLMAVVTSDTAGGLMARRLLPAALLVPPLMGWLRLIGERAGFYGFEFGLALFATSNVVVFTVLVWLTAFSLQITDTRRKRAEDSLKESEKKYRNLTENALAGIYISTIKGDVLYVNKALARIFEFESQEEMISQGAFARYKDNKDREILIENLRKYGKVEAFEAEMLTKNGKSINVLFNATLDGDVLSGVAIDITQRKRAEEELRKYQEHLEELVEERTAQLKESEERFRSVVESATDAIVSTDNEGNIISWNSAAEGIFGYTADEIIGKPITLLMPEQFVGAHEKGMKRTATTGESEVIGKAVECTGLKKDGKKFPIELSISTWKAGEKDYFAGIIRDITERKRAEEEIKKLNEDLTGQIMELEAVNKELEAFSYSVSHDLRAPLRAIDGFSRILLEEYTGVLDEEGKRLFHIIRSNTQKMGQLIDDLLTVSRIGRKALQESDVDMTALARSVMDELRSAEPHRTVAITIYDLPPAYGDSMLLRQVFTNLISNALKFTRPCAQPAVEISGYPQGSENIYYVKDNGVGFDMQYAGKLFGVFQRLHREEEFEGTGVGLAIVQRIIHRHRGQVWAEGAINQGATFYFSLPILEAEKRR